MILFKWINVVIFYVCLSHAQYNKGIQTFPFYIVRIDLAEFNYPIKQNEMVRFRGGEKWICLL